MKKPSRDVTSQIFVGTLHGRALLVNRPAGRFILRPRSAGSKGCAPACQDVSTLAGCKASSELRLFPQIPRHAKSIIRILKFRRDARPRRAARNLNLMPPRSPARTAPRPLRGSLRIPLRRRAVILCRKPIRAPLVHVRSNIAKPVRVSFRLPHRLRPALPARGIIRQMLRRLIAPRKLFLLHAAARRAFPFCFRRQTISSPASSAQPLAISHGIKPRRRHHRLLGLRKVRIAPVQRRAVFRCSQKSRVLRVRHLAFRHLKRIHPNLMHRPFVLLPGVAPHQEPPLGNRHHPRFDQATVRAQINRVAHSSTCSRVHSVNPGPPHVVSGSTNSQTIGKPPALPPAIPEKTKAPCKCTNPSRRGRKPAILSSPPRPDPSIPAPAYISHRTNPKNKARAPAPSPENPQP